jgi:hypothetical protein
MIREIALLLLLAVAAVIVVREFAPVPPACFSFQEPFCWQRP